MEQANNPAWKQDVNITVKLPHRKKKGTGIAAATGVTKLHSWASRGKKVGFHL